jgi:hypothetical protein
MPRRASGLRPIGVVAALCVILASAAASRADEARLQPGDFTYLGAFRLPETGNRPATFDYAGNGMAFNPLGDPQGAKDGFPGSLILTGHERIPFDVPDGDQLAEVAIPKPVASKSLGKLATAKLLRGFTDSLGRLFPAMAELPTVGLAYLDRPQSGPRIHVAFGQHFEPEPPQPTHGSFALDLSPASVAGAWFIGDESFYAVNGYLMEIPADWAKAHVGGRPLATGRFRDGGWSGMGPALFAYAPYDAGGKPAKPGARLDVVTLLHYPSSTETEDVAGALRNYQQPDEWEGAAWLTTRSGKSAVLFAGTKGVGAKYWYGFVNPAGPDQPCVYQEVVGQYPVCRLAGSGKLCPQADLTECRGHDEARGWWSAAFQAQFILYDPADLAKVAAGKLKPNAPQPYAAIPIDAALRLSVDRDVADWVGAGQQRRQRIGPVAYDRAGQLLYVAELFGDGARPLIHVWGLE